MEDFNFAQGFNRTAEKTIVSRQVSRSKTASSTASEKVVQSYPVYINGFAVRGPGFRAASELFEKLLEKRNCLPKLCQVKNFSTTSFF